MNTDPIADLLTRLRNATRARHEKTVVPSSKIKTEILRVMKEKKCIQNFAPAKVGVSMLEIELIPGRELDLKRVSKPGQRIYRKSTDILPVLRGFGFSILSTSKGVMTGEQAKKQGVGGEVICEIS